MAVLTALSGITATGLMTAFKVGAAVATIGSAAYSAKQSHDARKDARESARKARFDAAKERQQAANQEAEANRKRALGETTTVQTSALGNTGGTQVQKKTILGG